MHAPYRSPQPSAVASLMPWNAAQHLGDRRMLTFACLAQKDRARGAQPGSVVDAVRVGAVGPRVEGARPPLRVCSLWEANAGQVGLRLEVQ